jgi:hypothetical protein
MTVADMFDTPSPSVFVVLAEPSPQQEADFHGWYDKIHGPDALENGSFSALHRYRVAGPGWVQARYLAVWQGRYRSEPEAWDYIRPRAKGLRAAGRVGDVASVVWALVLLAAPGSGDDRAAGGQPALSLTTVQNDWRHPDPANSATDWWKASGLEDAPAHQRAQLYTSDPDGSGGGYHLALFENSIRAAEAVEAWQGIGEAGTSPTPPYRTIFAEPTEGSEQSDQSGPAGAPAPAPVWVMHWEHVTSLN